jgi:methionyl aminopeptidase
MAMTSIKTAAEIKSMRESGRLLATVLATLKEALQPGMTTKDLSEIAKRELRGTGGLPAFLGYPGPPHVPDYPDILCVSVNDEVVHGIPSKKRVIQAGDIVSMDFGVVYEGMITDAATSAIAGGTNDPKRQKLVQDTERSLYAGISAVKDGARVGDIGYAVESSLKAGRYGIVRDLVGHGVGHSLHEDPNVPNYGRAGTGPKLSAGMTIAIEPMVTLGGHRVYMDLDGWTVLTSDHSLSAHFEHTVLVTKEGYEILTQL